jgi:hypothetical protein
VKTYPSVEHLRDALIKASPDANRLGPYAAPVSEHRYPDWVVRVEDGQFVASRPGVVLAAGSLDELSEQIAEVERHHFEPNYTQSVLETLRTNER